MPSPAFLSGKPYGKVLFAAIDEYLYALGVPQNFYLLDAAAVAHDERQSFTVIVRERPR